MTTVAGSATDAGAPGIRGDSSAFDGVLGVSTAPEHAGVAGVNETGGNGVMGRGTGHGVMGTNDDNDGVQGFTKSPHHAGVVGTNTATGAGVLGQSQDGAAVHAISQNGTGLVASGSQRAGFFDGPVEVKGALTINGVPVVPGPPPSLGPLTERVTSLEQQVATLGGLIVGLESRVAILEARP
jgi:hypothetical protein